MFLKTKTMKSTDGCWDEVQRASRESAPAADGIRRLRQALKCADAVVIGAGAGLSSSAGFSYSGGRFDRYFRDFAGKYGIKDMYSGGFYPFPNPEEHWAFWSRMIYINRYMPAPRPVYEELYHLVRDKDYFVITTNVDHCFQKSGFAKQRLFYTQGDYGLWQCSVPCHDETYDNETTVRRMVEAQGFVIGDRGRLMLPEGTELRMEIPGELIPICPRCGKPMRMNLRADGTFVEDAGWHQASERYGAFLQSHRDQNVLFLELGVGYNTPGIIKYSFWKMTYAWKNAVYACVNDGDVYVPDEIEGSSICVNGDIGDISAKLRD